MITKETIILDLVSDHPETEAVFSRYDPVEGQCVLCSNLFDTLDAFCSAFNLEVEEFLEEIKRVL
ncbi:hypothetical protein [Acidaminobacter sp.]|uniref:hypothetical protein n=1 Tax=Acidaminobacter sp. TaxID=1872102 RepID=UPI00137EB780|nr:hypothetical protein [Acidaminobacter sp.]MDK9710126.1 hypothetical protein [Acidaminobacter sp.]MZQ98788.1 hypothetical protein [Acidaminobacter sp.]